MNIFYHSSEVHKLKAKKLLEAQEQSQVKGATANQNQVSEKKEPLSAIGALEFIYGNNWSLY